MTTTRFNTLPKTTQDLVFPDRRGYYSASPIPDLAEYFHKSRTDGISLSKGLSYTLRSAADAFERRGIFERLINSDLMAQMRGHNTCSRLNLLSSIVERISYPQNPTHLFDVFDYNNILRAIVTGDKQQLDARIEYVKRESWAPELSPYLEIAALFAILTDDGSAESLVPKLHANMSETTRYWQGSMGALVAIITGDADQFTASVKDILATSAKQNNVFVGTSKLFSIPAHGLSRLFAARHPNNPLKPLKQKLWDQEFHEFVSSLDSADHGELESLACVDLPLDIWMNELLSGGDLPKFGFRITS